MHGPSTEEIQTRRRIYISLHSLTPELSEKDDSYDTSEK